MAKKEKKSGLGRGLDSLIPAIEEKEVEEGISLEDLLKESEKEEIENEIEQFEEELVDEDKELVFTEEDFKTEDDILIEESDVEKYEDEIVEEEVEVEELDDERKESSEYTNVFFNDDEKIGKDEEKIIEEKSVENINSTVNLNEKSEESTKIIEAIDDINEVQSLLSEKEEKLIDEVIETVENNPRITLWSARSAAVLRFLRKTEPEFSISNEASTLIDEAIAKKYPEIWTLFNHL